MTASRHRTVEVLAQLSSSTPSAGAPAVWLATTSTPPVRGLFAVADTAPQACERLAEVVGRATGRRARVWVEMRIVHEPASPQQSVRLAAAAVCSPLGGWMAALRPTVDLGPSVEPLAITGTGESAELAVADLAAQTAAVYAAGCVPAAPALDTRVTLTYSRPVTGKITADTGPAT